MALGKLNSYESAARETLVNTITVVSKSIRIMGSSLRPGQTDDSTSTKRHLQMALQVLSVMYYSLKTTSSWLHR